MAAQPSSPTRLPRPSPSRSVTPSHIATRSTRARSNLPHPKVLPFPDQVRSFKRPSTPLTPAENSAIVSAMLSGYPATASRPMSRRSSSGRATPVITSASPPSAAFASAGPSTPTLQSPNASYVHLALPMSASSSRGRSQTSPEPLRPSVTASPSGIEGRAPAHAGPSSTVLSPPILTSTSMSPPSGILNRPMSLPEPSTLTAKAPSLRGRPTTKRSTDSQAIAPSATCALCRPPAANILGDHLYQSFLTGKCADVRLVVRKWGVGYLAHRMVLVQTGFFHSLFLSGFSEGGPARIGRIDRKGKRPATSTEDEWSGEDIELHFDDPNISRAAFEICLSRLYSSYPRLHFPSDLLPTPAYPLSVAFEQPQRPRSSLQSIHASLAKTVHLVTPRLLLSLLATTIYLGDNNLMKEVLSMILRTISPATIARYLAFSTGAGIGEEEWSSQDEEAARGLENLGHPLPKLHGDTATAGTPDSESGSIVRAGDAGQMDDQERSKVTDTSTPRRPTRQSSGHSTDTIRARMLALAVEDSATPSPGSMSINLTDMPHFYGFASNKIGEACACWLVRWGPDIFEVESNCQEDTPYKIWSHGGIPASYARAVLSSDSLFVKDEMARYRLARQVIELRRKTWDAWEEESGDISVPSADQDITGLEDDEYELQQVFARGIRYSHMTFDDLSVISSDIDAHTTLPYAPMQVLQAAHWAAADLRSRINAYDSVEPSPDGPHELGLTMTTSGIVSALSKPRRNGGSARLPFGRVPSSGLYADSSSSMSRSTTDPVDTTIYHPVPIDDTHRVGAGGLLFLSATTLSDSHAGTGILPDLGPQDETNTDTADNLSARKRVVPAGENTCFGLLPPSRTAAEIAAAFYLDEYPSELRWSKVEPFRFSVEFWGAELLGERERSYSTTHFYAGSWFNVYVQTIKKKEKGTQLGIYLHRQNPLEPFPTPSMPPEVDGSSRRSSAQEKEAGDDETSALRSPTSMSHIVGSPPPTPSAMSPSMSRSPSEPANMASQGKDVYRDPRSLTRAYFSIACASALGTAMIRFSSSPDDFKLSQSWGWKSSALRSEEYLPLPSTTDTNVPLDQLDQGVLGWTGEIPHGVEGTKRANSLRATVVVGVV